MRRTSTRRRKTTVSAPSRTSLQTICQGTSGLCTGVVNPVDGFIVFDVEVAVPDLGPHQRDNFIWTAFHRAGESEDVRDTLPPTMDAKCCNACLSLWYRAASEHLKGLLLLKKGYLDALDELDVASSSDEELIFLAGDEEDEEVEMAEPPAVVSPESPSAADSDALIGLQTEIDDLLEEERALLEELKELTEKEQEDSLGALCSIVDKRTSNAEDLNDELFRFSLCTESLHRLHRYSRVAKSRIGKLQGVRVFEDAFHIAKVGNLPAINRFLLGFLPNQSNTWKETNAALGEMALLLSLLGDSFPGFEFKSFRPVPRCGASFMEQVSPPGTRSALSSSSWRLPQELNKALCALLAATHELASFVAPHGLPVRVHHNMIGAKQDKNMYDIQKPLWPDTSKWILALRLLSSELKYIYSRYVKQHSGLKK